MAVSAAAVADARQLPRASAILLGAASRLRGAHDRTDEHVRELTGRGQAVLGEDTFASAYARGWQLTVSAAVAEIDPARLGREPGLAPGDPLE